MTRTPTPEERAAAVEFLNAHTSASGWQYNDATVAECFTSVRALAALIAAQREAAYAQGLEAAAKVVPYSWLDPLLTGPDSPSLPLDGPEVEKLLKGISVSIRALADRRSGTRE